MPIFSWPQRSHSEKDRSKSQGSSVKFLKCRLSHLFSLSLSHLIFRKILLIFSISLSILAVNNIININSIGGKTKIQGKVKSRGHIGPTKLLLGEHRGVHVQTKIQKTELQMTHIYLAAIDH